MKRRIYIEGYDCSTSISSNKEELWDSIRLQKIGIQDLDITGWPTKVREYWSIQEHSPRACTINSNHDHSVRDELVLRLGVAYKNATKNSKLESSLKVGFIYSATKGAIEDFIWEENLEAKLSKHGQEVEDPIDMVLEHFLLENKIENVALKQCVSNACASTHASLKLAKMWLDNGLCDRVVILAADYVGPFIQTGFKSLKALCSVDCKPFQDNRDGLVLGEAAACIILSHEENEFELKNVSIYNEAHAVTSPSPDGAGLFNCIDSIVSSEQFPELVFAHGTGTVANDATEDQVLANIQEKYQRDFLVTASKWSVGHCLGASGAVDFVLALSSMTHGEAIGIKAEETNQEKLKLKSYLYNEVKSLSIKNVLVNSLGFGGTNGAILVGRSNAN
ncbi:hypothetical protein A9Q84_01250 [Halobacteriovorax marinus]|uniref:Ketosynthase family 3 (KS3) domain-containing protein n=1 Tax=Halobacteriovorax marinus TaxID=97084 RepID=A0A1Y5FC58_9BACT|nr:hypothetical protein A9Q84_01250 [Halobacteriovorax marinus]